jgi:hypothetical protein
MRKQLGNLTIVADDEVIDRGYSAPNGKLLTKEELWKDNVFYEQDYFQIKALRNLHVVDQSGMVITPIINEVDVLNSGYVCTWHQKFWVQGYAVLEDKLFFAALGDDDGYYCRPVRWLKLSEHAQIGVQVSFETFLANMTVGCPEPALPEGSGVSRHMLLPQ